jgi:hypothetical protein
LTKLATFKPLPVLVGAGECGAVDAVLMDNVILADQAKVSVSPPATLRCTMAEQVAIWLREDVAPAVLKLGAPLRGLDNFDSYECRGRNRVRGATLSEHRRANALDVRGFKLANGETIGLTDMEVAIAWRAAVRVTACARFSTVPGPGSDGNHEEHIHVDLAERRGGYKTRGASRSSWRSRLLRKKANRRPSNSRPRCRIRCRCRARVQWRRTIHSRLPGKRSCGPRSSSELGFRDDGRDLRPKLRANYLPIITSEALMTAHAASPFCSARSATASLVIEAVMTMPWPTSIRTCEVVAPFVTSTILPFN